MMKLGINLSIWSHAGISFLEALKRAGSLGFKYIDLLGVGHLNPMNLSTSDIKTAKALIEDMGLSISSMVMLPRIVGNIASLDQEIKSRCLDYVKACIDVTRELGGKQVLMDAGEREIDVPFEESWKSSKEFIKTCSEYAKSKDVIITLELEPCMYSIVRDIPTMFKMLTEINSPYVLANIDVGHLTITRESPEDLKQLKGLIIHAHISDNDGRIHANEIIGTGATPVDRYLSSLIEIGLDETAIKNGVVPVAAIELGLIGQNIDSPERWVSESLSFIRKVCPWMSLD